MYLLVFQPKMSKCFQLASDLQFPP